jgi:hypothetical protein
VWAGFNYAMASNMGMVMRGIYSKKCLQDFKGMDGINLCVPNFLGPEFFRSFIFPVLLLCGPASLGGLRPCGMRLRQHISRTRSTAASMYVTNSCTQVVRGSAGHHRLHHRRHAKQCQR